MQHLKLTSIAICILLSLLLAVAAIGSVSTEFNLPNVLIAQVMTGPDCCLGPILPGWKITCTYAVTNLNWFSTIDVQSINDVWHGQTVSLLDDFKKANKGLTTIKPFKVVTFSHDYCTTKYDKGWVWDNATVTVKVGSKTDSACFKACMFVLEPPCISIEKEGTPDPARVDDTITYTYTVCNNCERYCMDKIPGFVLEVTSIQDTNPAIGNLLDEFKKANKQQNNKPDCEADELDPGECVTFTAKYKVQIDDPNPLCNCVTVKAEVDLECMKKLGFINFCIDGDDLKACDTDRECIDISDPQTKLCFLPVTFTQQGWHDFCNEALGVPGGMVFNKFPIAFARFGFFGVIYTNRVIIGAPDNVLAPGQHSMTFEANTSALNQLCRFLPQYGPCDKLYGNYMNQSQLKDKFGNSVNNVLAGEVLALTLNIGYNDMRLMPRSRGFDLEKFVLLQGPFKGKTVGQVLNIANAVLAGVPPCTFGLPNPPSAGCNALVDVLQRINANYHFEGIDSFIDRHYLAPNVPLGLAGPPHIMVVPS